MDIENKNTIRGLQNFGNSCFLNVVVQALWNLSSVKYFFFKIHSHNHEEYLQNKSFKHIIIFLQNFNYSPEDVVVGNDESEETAILLDQIKFKKTGTNGDGLSPNHQDKLIKTQESSNCLLCLMINFFTYYKYSSKKSLSTVKLRRILTKLNDYIKKFDDSGMGCSSEALEEMLNYFHRSDVFFDYLKFRNEVRFRLENTLDTLECTNKCLTHSVFITKYKEMLYCTSCKEISDFKFTFNTNLESFVFYVYSAEFISLVQANINQKKNFTIKNSIRLTPFKNQGRLEQSKCSTCGSKALKIIRMITYPSKVLTMNLNKHSHFDSIQNGYELLYNRIDQEISLSHIFEYLSLNNSRYLLRGFACFKDRHYIYVGYMIHTSCWTLCNDEVIENLGSWDVAKNYLIKNKWFPCLIFYELSDIMEQELLHKSDECSDNCDNEGSVSHESSFTHSSNSTNATSDIFGNPIDDIPNIKSSLSSQIRKPRSKSKMNKIIFDKGIDILKNSDHDINKLIEGSNLVKIKIGNKENAKDIIQKQRTSDLQMKENNENTTINRPSAHTDSQKINKITEAEIEDKEECLGKICSIF